MKIMTLNANGLRSAARKGFFGYLPRAAPDVLCVQETRASVHQLEAGVLNPPGWRGWLHTAERPGYSGVAIYSRREPDRLHFGLGLPDIDCEGRWLRADFGRLSIVSLYLPSGSSGEARQAVKFSVMERLAPRLEAMLAEDRDWLICGDWNIAHREIDLRNWRGNRKNSGFLPEERAWMDQLFGPLGWVDAFRHLHPEREEYTWWSNRGRARENNVGWRIDYQVASPALAACVRASEVYTAEYFSDHAPLVMDYDYAF